MFFSKTLVGFLFITDVEIVVLEAEELDFALDYEVDFALRLLVITNMVYNLSRFKSLHFHFA